ncbi:MAG: hypothetical protein ACP5DZ_05435 [Bacteroidales bacterium]
MKKIILICGCGLILFSGCTPPEYDAHKMHKRQKTLMELQEKAVLDDSLSDEEIDKIVQAHKENIMFTKSVLNKYKSDSVQMRVYKIALYDMNQKIKAKQDSVYHQVRISKRYDELRKRLFELYFGKHEK